MAYNGTIELISGIKPKNDGTFPLVNAADVYINDSTRLPDALADKADADTVSQDTTTTSISYTIVDNADRTFSATDITQVHLTIPSTVSHGFCAGVNIKNSAVAPTVTFTNSSSYALKIIQSGQVVQAYNPTVLTTATMSILCDGINVYCYINEV